MEFKAKRRKLRVTIDEKVYEVRFPRNGDLSEYRANVEGKSDEEKNELLSSLLEELGLPKAAVDELEPSDYKEIVGLLTDQKNG